jgi:prepilin-type N-terminal cleavage/methylation domain-containing protein
MKREQGFTLIEVLIAATILFTVLAVASETYRNALLASSKAQAVVEMLTPLPLVTSSIRNQLRANPAEQLEGAGELLGVQFSWQAETARYGAPAPRFDPDAADFIDYGQRYRLYDVKLQLRVRGHERSYLYQEIAWEPWSNLRR